MVATEGSGRAWPVDGRGRRRYGPSWAGASACGRCPGGTGRGEPAGGGRGCAGGGETGAWWSVGVGRRTACWRLTVRTVPFRIAAGAGVAAVIDIFWQGAALTAALGIAAGLLSITIAYVIARGAIAQHEVNSRSVAGAICVYMLFGMLFMFLYGVLAVVGHGPFFAQGTDGTRPLRLYFSYVTLATLGYGDYTPAGNLGHALAVLEALLGQLYLVTVVAVLVTRLAGPGRKIIARAKESEAGGPDT